MGSGMTRGILTQGVFFRYNSGKSARTLQTNHGIWNQAGYIISLGTVLHDEGRDAG